MSSLLMEQQANDHRGVIRLIGIDKNFGELIALHAIELSCATGQTTVLLGPSGCGKSTLLRLILGLESPSRGQVLFEGQTLSEHNIQQIRRRIGNVTQDGGLFPHLSALENVTLLARHLKQGAEQVQQKINELCDLTHISRSMLDRYPQELSGGQRQRVSLMRALMLDPEVLLLDEPLGALDPMVRANLQLELKQIFNTLGKTVLLVTHDLAEAAYFANTIVLLDKGRIVQQGTLAELRDQPSSPFVSAFLNAHRRLADF